jgi:hypothetical protein
VIPAPPVHRSDRRWIERIWRRDLAEPIESQAEHGGLDVVEAALRCVMQLDASVRGEYHDRLMAWLSPAVREKVNEMLEQHFPYPQSDFAKEHYGKGVREGEATLLLRMLTLRFGELPTEVEERVREADGETRLRWGERFVTATTLGAVFADE